ncbi:unnamed protein product [Mesocestoides corti]|uniref:Uncharacterized protein n=2 Tax=Mesocestoides corti TaxID=53468 RepID=A0A0R3UKZ2_MESCO|nr:unnamed protein product [Mesocestoides corti]
MSVLFNRNAAHEAQMLSTMREFKLFAHKSGPHVLFQHTHAHTAGVMNCQLGVRCAYRKPCAASSSSSSSSFKAPAFFSSTMAFFLRVDLLNLIIYAATPHCDARAQCSHSGANARLGGGSSNSSATVSDSVRANLWVTVN